MKEERKEPVFLLEMPHTIRHLIMKRGQMLRSGKTRTLMCVGKGDKHSWLEAKLIPSFGEHADENWNKAHELAERFKRELHTDVYVEPAGEKGRFKELTAPAEDDFGMGADFLNQDVGTDHDFGMGVNIGGSVMPGLGDPFGSSMDMGFGRLPGRSGGGGAGMFGMGPSGFGMGGSGMPNIPGMPHIPDPMKDLLPASVRQAMGMETKDSAKKKKKATLSFPALRALPGWSELSENKQKMFEVEAAQLQPPVVDAMPFGPEVNMPEMAGALADTTVEDEKALATLSVNPKISAALKRFLLENFEAATKVIETKAASN